GIDLLGEAEVSGIAGALVEPGAGECGPGIGGGGLLGVGLVPPHAARAGAAAGGVPTAHNVRVESGGLVEVLESASEVVGVDEGHRHPAFIIIVAARPTARALALIEALDQAEVLLAAGALDA